MVKVLLGRGVGEAPPRGRVALGAAPGFGQGALPGDLRGDDQILSRSGNSVGRKARRLPAAQRTQPAPAWRILAFSVLAMTITVFGQTAGVAVFVDPVAADLNLSRSQISTAYSLATLLAALCLPSVGRRIDHHGARHLTLAAAFGFGVVLMALALAQGLTWLAVGMFGLRLLGPGALSLTARTIVSVRFRSRLGGAVGISGTLAAITMSFAPLLLANVIATIGWRTTWLLAAIAVCITGIGLSLWLLRPGEDRPRAHETAVIEAEPATWSREQALRTPIFWAITASYAAVAMIVTGLAFHQISILGEAGLPPTLAAANFIPQTVASMAAIALVSLLSSRLSPGLLLVGSLTCLATGLLLLLALDHPWAPLLYALAVGAALGSTQAIDGTLLPRLFGVRAIAAIRGTGFAVAVAGSAVGPIAVALIREGTGSYDAVAPVLIGIPLLLGVAALLVREPRRPSLP